MTKARQTKQDDAIEGAFPASEATPGQAESRAAREAFLALRETCPWWNDYLTLRTEGWDWRKAAYIAWASSPGFDRWPENQEELAKLIGLRSDRVLRKWREKDPTIDERVAAMQLEPLLRHRRDAVNNLVERASGDDKFAFQYMKIMFQMTGDLDSKKKGKPAGGASSAGGGNEPQSTLSDAELEQQIRNLASAYPDEEPHAEHESDDAED